VSSGRVAASSLVTNLMKSALYLAVAICGFLLFGLGSGYLFADAPLIYRLRSLGAIVLGALLVWLAVRAAWRDRVGRAGGKGERE